METRAQQFAVQFEAVNNDLMATVERCDSAQWLAGCVNDERSAAAIAHHVASVNETFVGMLAKFAAGDTYTPNTSMEDIHRMNAEHAREFASVDRQTVLDLLRSSGATMTELLTGLSDDVFERHAGVFGGHALSVSQVIEFVVVGHTAEHLETIQNTLALSTPAGG